MCSASFIISQRHLTVPGISREYRDLRCSSTRPVCRRRGDRRVCNSCKGLQSQLRFRGSLALVAQEEETHLSKHTRLIFKRSQRNKLALLKNKTYDCPLLVAIHLSCFFFYRRHVAAIFIYEVNFYEIVLSLQNLVVGKTGEVQPAVSIIFEANEGFGFNIQKRAGRLSWQSSRGKSFGFTCHRFLLSSPLYN